VTQPKNPSRGERRFAHRFRAKKTSHIHCWESGRNLAVCVLNLCQDGAGLLLSEPLSQGQPVTVGLRAAEWAEEVRVPATVLWSRHHVHGGWRTGVAFSRPLGLATLYDLCQLPG